MRSVKVGSGDVVPLSRPVDLAPLLHVYLLYTHTPRPAERTLKAPGSQPAARNASVYPQLSFILAIEKQIVITNLKKKKKKIENKN